MAITVQSAKAKGRRLQQWVRDKLYALFPTLEEGDVTSTSMGAGGEDIKLSPAARKLIPYSIECKQKKKHSVYTMYDQAIANSGKHTPLLIVRQDRREALVVVDAEHFFKLIQEQNGRT